MLNAERLDEICRVLLQGSGIPDSEVGALVSLVGRCFQQELADKAVLCREGENGDRMWLLLEGAIRVSKKDFLGAAQELAVVEAPTMIGHMSLVDNSRRSATCEAVGEVHLANLDRSLYQALVTDRSSVGDMLRRLILASMVAQMAAGSEKLRTVLDLASKARAEPSRASLEEISGALQGWSAPRRPSGG